MAINKVCKEKRTNDNNIKTQIRFGKHDLEVFTKNKTSGEAFKITMLDDFLDKSKLPTFEHSITWKKNVDRAHRKKFDYSKRKLAMPSSVQPSTSNTSRQQPAKERNMAISQTS